MRSKIQAKRLWKWFWISVLLVQVLIWIYFNFHYQFVNDNDHAKVLYKTIAMWEEKKMVIPNWIYMTTGEWDNPCLLALPLYGLTGNLLLSFAIVNSINVLFLTGLILLIFKWCNLSISAGALTATVVLIPFGIGILAYNNMMFYGASQYYYKVLLPIWLIEILLIPKEYRHRILHILQLIFFFTVCFISALSSGLYVFACAFFPIFALGFLKTEEGSMIQDKHEVYVSLAVLVLSALGYLVQKGLHLSTLTEDMRVLSFDHFFEQLHKNITALFELTGALPVESVPLYSMTGIAYVARFLLLLSIVVLGFSGLLTQRITSGKVLLIRRMLVAITVWNFIVMQLTDPSGRYWIIGFVPLIISAGLQIQALFEHQLFLYRWCGSLFLIVVIGFAWKHTVNKVGNHYDTYFETIEKYAEEANADTIVFINNSGMEEIGRVFLHPRKLVTFFTADQELRVHDQVEYMSDRSALDARHLLIETEQGSLSRLRENLQTGYKKLGEISNGVVYLSTQCHLDGKTGPMDGRTTIDFPDSPGYIYAAHFAPDGRLIATGEDPCAVKSPAFKSTNTVHVLLKFEIEGENTGRATIEYGDKSETIQLSSNNSTASFSVPPMTSFSFSVYADQECQYIVDSFIFKSE